MHLDCCTSTNPYPEGKPRRQDVRLAQRLFPLWSGGNGELAAISSYCCAALQTEEHSPALGEMFEDMAQCELTHFRLLGWMMRGRGGDPVLDPRGGMGGNNRYDLRQIGMKQMFEQYMRREQAAADTYRYLAAQTEDEAVRALLMRIAEDEEHHAFIFARLYRG